jgi:chloramphenicol 3-O-phosphotransferase
LATHKTKTQIRIFAVNLTELNVESVLWKFILLKNCVHLYIACGNLMVNVDQQRNVQRLEQKKQEMFFQPLYDGTVV